jgi:hypothetical protein
MLVDTNLIIIIIMVCAPAVAEGDITNKKRLGLRQALSGAGAILSRSYAN